jgi:hypothetical protein
MALPVVVSSRNLRRVVRIFTVRSVIKVTGEGKVHPITGHKDPDGE